MSKLNKDKFTNPPLELAQSLQVRNPEMKEGVAYAMIKSKDINNESAIDIALEYATVYDKFGHPICGQARKFKQNPCKRDAGWGTEHFGYGACKDHEVTKRQEVIYLDIADDAEINNSLRLYQENLELLDNNDGEIMLARTLLQMNLKGIKSELIGTPFGKEQLKSVNKLLGIVNNLIATRKELKKNAGEMVSRTEVLEFFNKAQLVLQNYLRNHCPKCKYEHGMQKLVLKKLEELGNL